VQAGISVSLFSCSPCDGGGVAAVCLEYLCIYRACYMPASIPHTYIYIDIVLKVNGVAARASRSVKRSPSRSGLTHAQRMARISYRAAFSYRLLPALSRLAKQRLHSGRQRARQTTYLCWREGQRGVAAYLLALHLGTAVTRRQLPPKGDCRGPSDMIVTTGAVIYLSPRLLPTHLTLYTTSCLA